MVQITEELGGEVPGVKVGHHHALRAGGGHALDQAHRQWRARAAPILGILGAGPVDRDVRFDGRAAREGLDRRPAAVVVAADDEADTSLHQRGQQPARGVAAVKHQHVVGLQALQRLHQHRPLGDAGTVDAGVKHELGTGQVKREQPLIRLSQVLGSSAAANGRHEHRGVAGHHTQAVPSGDQARSVGPINQPIVEPRQRGHVQVRAGLGKGAVADAAVQRPAGQVAEEGLKMGRNSGAALNQQARHEGGQRQLALASEGVFVLRPRPSGAAGEVLAVEDGGEFSQERPAEVKLISMASMGRVSNKYLHENQVLEDSRRGGWALSSQD